MKLVKNKVLSFVVTISLCFALMLSSGSFAIADDLIKNLSNTTIENNQQPVRSDNYMKLWYDEPGKDWFTGALPLGNGNIGGMACGKTDVENIQLNEVTLWSGGPNSVNNYTGGNTKDAYKSLDKIRNDVLSGKKPNVNPLLGNQRGWKGFQNVGDLQLDFTGNSRVTNPQNYRRELDLNTAVEAISYSDNGVDYKREYFISNPGNVMVIHLTSSQADALSFDLRLNPDYSADDYYKVSKTCDIKAQNNIISCLGEVRASKMKFAVQIAAISKNADIANNTDGSLSITNGEDITIVMSIGTNYDITESKKLKDISDFSKPEGRIDFIDDNDPDGTVVMSEVAERVANASAKPYSELRKIHVDDYSKIFGRVEIDLGQSEYADVSSDLLATKYYRNGKGRHYFETLMFQYGRYLLLASSRDAVLPANLQGIWNNDNKAEWGCDYHLNVNIQMNYWSSLVTNMVETIDPLVSYLDYLRGPGHITAKEHFGVINEDAWVANTVTTPMGMAGVGWEFYWGWTPGCAAWICDNIWDYYLYTEDPEVLKKVYPIIKGAALFWKDFLIEDPKTGNLISCPATSSEHGPISAGTTYDIAFAKMIMQYAIDGGKIIGEDQNLLNEFQSCYDRIHPYEIGASGQIKEWREEVTYNEDANGKPLGQYHHRHFSHLLGLHPGRLINANTPDLLEAAIRTIEYRGGGSGVGWSGSQSACLWSRTGNGDNAYEDLIYMLKWSLGPNLLNEFPELNLFQIDGNFGLTSAMSEMLIQSQAGYIDVLPAIPQEWKTGSYKGLVARGNFETDVKWEDMNIQNIRITSRNGNKCKVHGRNIGLGKVTSNGEPVVFTKLSDDMIEFDTTKGGVYVIDDIKTSLQTPQDILVERVDENKVYISWEKVDKAVKYNLYRVSEGGIVEFTQKDITANEYYDENAKYGEKASYYYRIEAVDKDGNIGHLSRSVKEQQDTRITDDILPDVHYHGNWDNSIDFNSFKNTLSVASNVGDYAEYVFVGTGLEIYTTMSNDLDSADIYIDGNKVDTVDLYKRSTMYNQLAFRIDNLTYGRHRVRVEVPEKLMHSEVKSPKIAIDYFSVLTADEYSYGKYEIVPVNGLRNITPSNNVSQLKINVHNMPGLTVSGTWNIHDDEGYLSKICNINSNGLLSLASRDNGFISVSFTSNGKYSMRIVSIFYVDAQKKNENGFPNVLINRPVTLVEGGYLSATYSPKHLTDGYACLDNNYQETNRFASPGGQDHFVAEIPLDGNVKVDDVIIYERWAKDGQKLWDNLYITYTEVQAFVDDKWEVVGKSVGFAEKINGRTALRKIKCKNVVTNKLRFRIETERSSGASIWEIEAYGEKL